MFIAGTQPNSCGFQQFLDVESIEDGGDTATISAPTSLETSVAANECGSKRYKI
jgi:hypothetical protein